MQKPSPDSKDAITAEDLFQILKTKEEWTTDEIFAILAPKYPAYDKAGLKHKIRHVLYYHSKQGRVERTGKGTYQIKTNNL